MFDRLRSRFLYTLPTNVTTCSVPIRDFLKKSYISDSDAIITYLNGFFRIFFVLKPCLS